MKPLARNENKAGSGQKLSGSVQQRKLVARVREYLLRDNNYANADITPDTLVALLGVNRTGLFTALKAVTGKTPREYLQSIRIEEARRALESDFTLTIDMIVESHGFASRSTFYRLFHEEYNISPAKYRKMDKL